MILYNKSYRELLKQIEEFGNFISTEEVSDQLEEIIESIYNISIKRVSFEYDVDIFKCSSLEVICESSKGRNAMATFNDDHDIRYVMSRGVYIYIRVGDILHYLQKEDTTQLINEIQTPTYESLKERIDALEDKIDQLIDLYKNGCDHDCSSYW